MLGNIFRVPGAVTLYDIDQCLNLGKLLCRGPLMQASLGLLLILACHDMMDIESHLNYLASLKQWKLTSR